MLNLTNNLNKNQISEQSDVQENKADHQNGEASPNSEEEPLHVEEIDLQKIESDLHLHENIMDPLDINNDEPSKTISQFQDYESDEVSNNSQLSDAENEDNFTSNSDSE